MDKKYMAQALDLAKKGQGRTKKNPMVGAVIVKDGQVLGQGYHKAYGGPHAEREALADAQGKDIGGATIYVSLEPCCHQGKTPPCTQALIEAGLGRVVVATLDPNDKVAGKGVQILREAGIQVDVGILEEEAQELNHVFFRRMETGRPYCLVKIAMSLDGKTATKTGEAKWISSEESRKDGHYYRAWADAILVGSGTVLADDPSLTNRSGQGQDPIRVILDSSLSTPLEAKILHLDSPAPTVIFTAVTDDERIQPYRDLGAELISVGKNSYGLDLEEVLAQLDKMGVARLLVEGGGRVHGSFLDQGLIDGILAYLAPILIGGQEARPAIGGQGVGPLKEALALRTMEVSRSGPDIKILGRL